MDMDHALFEKGFTEVNTNVNIQPIDICDTNTSKPVTTTPGTNCDPFNNNNTGGPGLPDGARNPTWNGAFVETHYIWNPQFLIFQRSEWIRMSQQSLAGTPSNFGDIDAYTVGYRWYPIMTSRAGLAFHNEYSWVRQRGTSPVSATDLTNNSLFFGFDFDF